MVQTLPVWKTTSRTLICRHSEMARIFKSTSRIWSTSMVFSLTTNTAAQILISPVHSNVKTISCVQKLVIRILCASLAYKERVVRIHSVWSFHVVVLQRTVEKCAKNYNARTQLLFCSLNLLFSDVAVAFVVFGYGFCSSESEYFCIRSPEWKIINAQRV